MVASIIKILLRIFFKLFYNVKISGIENVPKSGSAIICSNHVGYMDPLLIGYKLKRVVRWIAKEELFKNFFLAFVLKSCGTVPLKRGKADITSIKTAMKIIKNEHILGIFPEGTRTLNKKIEDIRIKPGVGLIAAKTQVPIIPVSLKYKTKLFSEMIVCFGEPFVINIDKDNLNQSDQYIKISEDIMQKVYSKIS